MVAEKGQEGHRGRGGSLDEYLNEYLAGHIEFDNWHNNQSFRGSSRATPQKIEPRESLWDRAYEDLRREQKDLIDAYEKLLDAEISTKPSNSIKLGDPTGREHQMSSFVEEKLAIMNKEQWRFQVGDKSVEVRQQVDRIVKVVLVAKDFISSVASMDPIHAGLPWAGVCMLLPVSTTVFTSIGIYKRSRLQLVVNDSKQRAEAIDGLEYVSKLVRRCTEIEHIYLQDSDIILKEDLEAVMIKLYSQVLEYEARATCQFTRNGALQFARNLVEADGWKGIIDNAKSLETECDSLLRIIDAKDQRECLKRLELRIDNQTQKVQERLEESHIQDQAFILTELKASRAEQELYHTTSEESDCYECLRTTDYESNKNKNPDRIPGTCEWFLGHMKYRNWLDEQASAWLWVTADPGCGKSVLSKSLVNNFQNTNSTERTSVCYYFFKDDSDNNRSASHAMCAILHQLFSQNQALMKHAMPAFRRNGKELPQLFETLWNVLISAAADPGAGTVICILDALDECAESSRLPLIRELARFYKNQGQTSKLKFIFTSRPYSSISHALWWENPNVKSIQLAGENENELEVIRTEIALVIEVKVKRFHELRCSKGIRDDAHIAIRAKLDEIENRTYLWVALIFPELERNAGLAKAKLLRTIQAIPATVNEAYEAILARSSDADQAEKLLHIVVAAIRPLTLAEMNIALSIREGSSSMDELQLELVPESSFEETIRELCGLFVSIIDEEIYLIHQTAKEFLVAERNPAQPAATGKGISERKEWKHSLHPIESNIILARICISYLQLDVFGSHPLITSQCSSCVDSMDYEYSNTSETSTNADESSISSTYQPNIHVYINRYLLLDYASNYWALHYREADIRIDMALFRSSSAICDSQSQTFKIWSEIYDDEHFTTNASEVMLRSHFGHEGAVKLLLDRGVDPNIKTGRFKETALACAARAGHDVIVAMLLERGADVDSQDDHGYTPLFFSTGANQEKITSLLLENGANPNFQYSKGKTALRHAVEYRYEEIIAMLVEKGASSNISDFEGKTPLMCAAGKRFEGAEKAMKLLLEKGANPNSQDSRGKTALMLAVKNGDRKVVAMLLEKGASLNMSDFEGKTLLMYAAGSRFEGTVGVIRLLLQKGANPNAQNSNGETALMHAADCENEKAVIIHEYGASRIYVIGEGFEGFREFDKFERAVGVVGLLLEKGANLNAQDSKDRTALIYAVKHGPEKLITTLLEKGASLNISDFEGKTPLMYAIGKIYWEAEGAVRLLLEKGADTKAQDLEGKTALMYAAKYEREEIFIMLLEKGANPNTQDFEGKTVMMYAAKYGREEMVAMLLVKGVNANAQDSKGATPLLHAGDGEYKRIMVLLLEKGTSPNISDFEGRTPLICAANGGHEEVVKLLLEKGASPNISDLEGKTPLMCAANEGHEEVVKLLLENGASPNISDFEGKTPLICAANGGHEEVVKLLLEKGVSPNISDLEGKTPLMCAANMGYKEVVELLLEEGAEINAAFMDGITAFSLADMNGHDTIAKRLLDEGSDGKLINWETQTNLHMALFDAWDHQVEEGIERTANLNCKGGNGWTPLHYVAFRGWTGMMELLLDRSADPDLENNAGETPLLLAVRSDEVYSVRLLAHYCLRKKGVWLDLSMMIDLDMPTLKLAAQKDGHNGVLRTIYPAFDLVDQDSAPPSPRTTEPGS
ncbi:MAG: hypothetical protein Q9187_003885 [Circinaria calcarea]